MTENIESNVVRLSYALLSAGGWLATAESCTGGMIAAAATAIAGSSRWFDQGWVTYSNEAKQIELGVSEQSLMEFGAVSEQVAAQMAQGVLAMAPKATLSIVTTGIAGPGGGTPAKPVGLVWFGWARRLSDGRISVSTDSQIFSGDRSEVRYAAVNHAFNMANQLLSDAN